MSSLAIVILAAGKGKRMGNPDLPKVLSLLHGRPLLAYVLDQAKELNPDRCVVIVGHRRDLVEEFVALNYPWAECVTQAEQLGTGHAVMQCAEALADFHGDVLVLSGDVPLLKAASLSDFISQHRAAHADASVLSCVAPDPTGYGRIIRDTVGNFTSIVEHRDTNELQRSVDEVNSGIYVLSSALLFDALAKVGNSNAQQEYYLTDVIAILRAEHKQVSAFTASNFQELMGINTLAELAEAERILAAHNP